MKSSETFLRKEAVKERRCTLHRKAWGEARVLILILTSVRRNSRPCLAPTVNSSHEITSCLSSWWHSFPMAGEWLFPFALSLWMCVYKKVTSSQPYNVGWGIFRGVSALVCVMAYLSFCLAKQAFNKFQGLRTADLLLKYYRNEYPKSDDEINGKIDNGLKRLLKSSICGWWEFPSSLLQSASSG